MPAQLQAATASAVSAAAYATAGASTFNFAAVDLQTA